MTRHFLAALVASLMVLSGCPAEQDDDTTGDDDAGDDDGGDDDGGDDDGGDDDGGDDDGGDDDAGDDDAGDDDAGDDDSTPPLCAGVAVGGFCWYLSDFWESCSFVCSSHGLYDEATRTYAGSAGTIEDCNDVLEALGAGSPPTADAVGSSGVGCVVDTSGLRFWYASPETNEWSGESVLARACACTD